MEPHQSPLNIQLGRGRASKGTVPGHSDPRRGASPTPNPQGDAGAKAMPGQKKSTYDRGKAEDKTLQHTMHASNAVAFIHIPSSISLKWKNRRLKLKSQGCQSPTGYRRKVRQKRNWALSKCPHASIQFTNADWQIMYIIVEHRARMYPPAWP